MAHSGNHATRFRIGGNPDRGQQKREAAAGRDFRQARRRKDGAGLGQSGGLVSDLTDGEVLVADHGKRWRMMAP